MDGLLITLGDSWVKGIGAHYTDGMTRDEYKENRENEELIAPLAFRTLLAERNNLELKNFAVGGSSNKKQFRLATEFFSSAEFEEYQNKYSTIIVLWGITSTARTELYDVESGKWENLLYGARNNKRLIPEYQSMNRLMLERFYEHEEEVDVLSHQMKHWNEFFKSKGVKNLWFDILNHHEYKFKFDNLCMSYPRDLLSKVTIHKERDKFHFSTWTIDCSRVKKGLILKTLNPHSNHPTKKGHEKIFNLLDPYIKDLLPRN